jgi:two-component system response regulator
MTVASRPNPLQVLLVEDDPGDILMTREALEGQDVAHDIHVARDGVEALELLRGEGRLALAPDVVLLDLNLPRMDGREVLAAIREDGNLTHLPVVVLTTSANEADVVESHRLHANAFVTKPSDYDSYVGAVRSIERFFAGVATLPPRVALS